MHRCYERIFLATLSSPVQWTSERYNPLANPEREAAWIDTCQRASTVWR